MSSRSERWDAEDAEKMRFVSKKVDAVVSCKNCVTFEGELLGLHMRFAHGMVA